ncbi:MAG: hypothetical protein HN763_05905, partial [Opitutales bacterium]|nr:hypothetical protein [Opitutales bacterium]
MIVSLNNNIENMDISRRRFIGNIVFPVGGMTLMPLLSLKAAGNYGSWIPLFNGKDLT